MFYSYSTLSMLQRPLLLNSFPITQLQRNCVTTENLTPVKVTHIQVATILGCTLEEYLVEYLTSFYALTWDIIYQKLY